MECPKCHAELSREARFCWRCGAVLAVGASPVAPTTESARPQAPAQRGSRLPLIAGAVVGVLLLALALLGIGLRGGKGLTATGRGPVNAGGPVVAGTPGNVAPSGAAATPVTGATPGENSPASQVTATPPANAMAGPAVTGAQPANLPAAQPLPGGSRDQRPADHDDVAAYLRKLEAIQNRDAQNPMAQLFGLMATGLDALTRGLRDIQGEGGPSDAGSPQAANSKQVLDNLMRTKQTITRDFQAIKPVPASCLPLHKAYGLYLSSQLQAITAILSSMDAQNPSGALAALPQGQVAEAAKKAADDAEKLVRDWYHIPKGGALGLP